MFTDPITGEKKDGIARVRYSHDAMIDLLIAEPTVSQRKLAEIFDRTETWVSLVVNSDAFQARLAERRAELVDPAIMASIQERLQAVASASLEKLHEKLLNPAAVHTDDFLFKSAELATKALGYGARTQNQGGTNVAVVIQVPGKASSAQEWASRYSTSDISDASPSV